jgi:hypothetical protein
VLAVAAGVRPTTITPNAAQNAGIKGIRRLRWWFMCRRRIREQRSR